MYDDLGAKNAYIGVYVQMDDTYKYTVRKVASVATAFSATGGFMTIIALVTLYIVSRMQSTVYFSSLIKSFYTY